MSMAPAQARSQPFFIDTADGRRFCMYSPPVGHCRGAVLYIHPFAEEMNKSRRMAALQARALAERGYGVLQIDLHGCGDSSGESGEARWDGWRRDVDAGGAWLRERLGQPVALWGLRLGALLALDCAQRAPQPPAALVLWQPVLSGSAFLTQFLRLRVANQMLGGAAAGGGGTAALRAALAAGETLEVAGYELAPELAGALDQAGAAALAVRGCPVHWLEVAPSAERALPPAAAKVAALWREQGVELQLLTVPGAPFWATQEITECPALLEATAALFEEATA